MYRPAWSPDGREIAFSACCEEGRLYLYAVGADRGPRRRIVENAWWPTWSRDGSSIAYFGSLAGSPRLFVARSDGSGARILARATDGRSPSWSGASDRIALNATGTGRFQSAVAVVSVAGGRASLVVDGLRRLGEPEWSPRDDRIAFSDDDLRTVDTRTGDVLTVAGGPLLQIEPRWSPRGDLLVFGSETEHRDWPRVGAYLEVARADGSERVPLTPESPPASRSIVSISKVLPPDRLLVGSVRVRPASVRPGGTITARVVVEVTRTGELVDGAWIQVHAPPVPLGVLPRRPLTRAGVLTMRIRLRRVPRDRDVVRFVFVAEKPGDPREEVRSARFRVLVPIRH